MPTPPRRWFLFAACLVFCATTVAPAAETPEQQIVVSINRIWDTAAHSAFTDLISFRGHLYCSFREGSGHIPGLNGTVRVIRSKDGTNWESIALLDEPHVDLRDPKLSVTPDGRLMLNMGASYYEGRERKRIESRAAFSDTEGNSFGHPKRMNFPESIATDHDWLWRITWREKTAWGAIQQLPIGKPRSLQLVKSADGLNFEHVATLPVETPSETTLRFVEDGTLYAMIRRSIKPGPSEGQLGIAKPPYTQWDLKTTDRGFGGPNFVRLPGGTWLAGSRTRADDHAATGLWKLDFTQGAVDEFLVLPSNGDNSYPGFVVDEKAGRIYVSYYSGHEGKAAIYLAVLRLDALK